MAHPPNGQPSILNVHTPTSSFAIFHSITQDSLEELFDKLSRKAHTDYHGQQVGPGWLKYEYNGTIWDLDDESDYAIFVWRQQQHQLDSPDSTINSIFIPSIAVGEPGPSRLSHTTHFTTTTPSPTLYLHSPSQPLPVPSAYRNPSYYTFRPTIAPKISPAPSSNGKSSRRSARKKSKEEEERKDAVPKLMKQFEKFHNENGVRTVTGSIGPVQNVRMLLKAGYRHVYISRKFAQKHGFIPSDATPGNYGYGGLVNIGVWPITLVASTSSPVPGATPDPGHSHHDSTSIGEHESLLRPPTRAGAIGLGISGARQGHGSSKRSTSPGVIVRTSSRASASGASPLLNGTIRDNSKKTPHHRHEKQQAEDGTKPNVTLIQVYLSEEPHFDVVLGRSFFEKRQIKTSAVDPTDVVCMDTGEKIECEVVILKDGKGEIVTVT